ncbi:MAG TPA: helix-turn-helix transcriptional regulator [Vicinamibacterales bacterium]|jgi:PadR family transcriptional regulator PadR|nr:helix-turn-helix transcriptional regulator [Vicinamibacterales bacterium]
MADFLGEFEQLILFAVLQLGDDAYGVTVREAIQSRTGRTISAGAVYTTLERLESRGFVSSWFGDPTPARGGRRKRHFRVEPDGRRALRRTYDGLQRMAHGVIVKLEPSR